MTVGIVGLGLIGGSMARAIKRAGGHEVLAFDRSREVFDAAAAAGAADGELSRDSLGSVDLLLLALYPRAAVEHLSENAALIKKGSLVVDLCGVKGAVCPPCFALAEKHGFHFIGGHPMAGRERSGFAASSADLFDGASMVLVPPESCPDEVFSRAEGFFLSLGFGRVQRSTAEEHDREIAYTSQLAHVVSSAYVQSESALRHFGFSAGSFRDLTRVARLKPDMWCELFLENREPLCAELRGLIDRLQSFESAIESGDEQALTALLERGTRMKEASENG